MGATTMSDEQNKSREERIAEKRAELLDLTEEHAEQELYDEKYNWIRGRDRRRQLVVATIAAPVLHGLANYMEWPFLSLLFILAFGAGWFLLRRATRSITDLPAEFLDERMLKVRSQAYYHAYLGAVSVLSIVLLLAVGNLFAVKAQAAEVLTGSQFFDLVLAAMFVIFVLPSCIFAWNEPEV